jgi:hypothetical protein
MDTPSELAGFRRRVDAILALLGCYGALISYQRFGKIYRSHLQGSNIPRRIFELLPKRVCGLLEG